jgi:hypothetical protein
VGVGEPAGCADGVGVGVDDGVLVGCDVAVDGSVGVDEGTEFAVRVAVGCAVAVADGRGVDDDTGFAVGVAVGFGVYVAVGLGVEVAAGVGEARTVGVGVAVPAPGTTSTTSSTLICCRFFDRAFLSWMVPRGAPEGLSTARDSETWTHPLPRALVTLLLLRTTSLLAPFVPST